MPKNINPLIEAEMSGALIIKRYRDAYLVANFIVGFATLLKVLAWIFLFTLAIVAGWSNDKLTLLSLGISIIIFIIAILVSAAGQMLHATLDTAVHSSPFLNEQQKLQAMLA